MTFSVLGVVGTVVALYLVGKVLSSVLARPPAPLPPGPRGLPIIGNVFDLPKTSPHLHWAKHKSLYGPISSVTILGETIVILNDKRIAFEALEKKSNNYSNRPSFTFGGELCGMDACITFLQPGPRFRSMRKQFHQYIGTRQAAMNFEPIEELEIRRFLYRTMQDSSNFIEHLRTLSAAVMLKVAYGYDINPNGPDPLVDLIHKTMANFSKSILPGTWIVDTIPSLKHIPGWVPGMGFQRVANEYKSLNITAVEVPYEFVRRQMRAGSLSRPNFTSSYLEQESPSKEDEDILKWSATAMYGGGSHTTVSANASFFLAMVLYPEVLKRAQAEIDSVVGPNRLPTFADRSDLPYIDAVVKETLRWNVVVPIVTPHVAAEADIVEGFFIPKGAILLPNIWVMTKDPENYHDPAIFKPERFLGTQPETDPRTLAFGFGRRICPGIELAEASVFLTIAMSVAAFDIRKAKDARGIDIEPRYEYTDDLVSHPKDFVCSITQRSQKAAELIRSVQEEYPFGAGDADKLDPTHIDLAM